MRHWAKIQQTLSATWPWGGSRRATVAKATPKRRRAKAERICARRRGDFSLFIKGIRGFGDGLNRGTTQKDERASGVGHVLDGGPTGEFVADVVFGKVAEEDGQSGGHGDSASTYFAFPLSAVGAEGATVEVCEGLDSAAKAAALHWRFFHLGKTSKDQEKESSGKLPSGIMISSYGASRSFRSDPSVRGRGSVRRGLRLRHLLRYRCYRWHHA